MKLSEKIAELRKKQGWSQEELAFRLGVSRQSVSKWESGTALPEVDKIVQLADMFGVSCDYLMKNDLVSAEVSNTNIVADETASQDDSSSDVTGDSFDDYEQEQPVDKEYVFGQVRKGSILNAIGVMLCVLCPVLLIFLVARADGGFLSENLAVGLGIGALFVLVAAGVFLIIIASKCQVSVSLNSDMQKQVKRHLAEVRPFFITTTAIATVLCIVAVVPLVVAAVAEASEYIVVEMVCVLLIIVAVAVALFVFVGTSTDSYKRLSRGEIPASEKKKENIVDKLSEVYWMLVLAGYLIWSFLANSWGISWIVWPIAGVLSAVLKSILNLAGMGKDDDD